MANETPEVSKLEQRLDQKATPATSAALAAVNGEKSWFAKNWKQLAGILIAVAIAVYIIHKL